ncbi:hypothetical protein J2S70_000240 [Trueperella bonasi]|uniref:Uncharacterized protein n=1 Tax=Trueperella bonasi TaxID=312286 RepID=A0ABT9NE39_9ACTO|nr:hypothetical protein [Trueperella bonasi]MDP9805658.1 hypothetical protein [Trueperella bonasi]
MSETPRLSRRELRELGKLEALPADEVTLTETAELRLRRPSRKELREAAEREKLENNVSETAQESSDEITPAAEVQDAVEQTDQQSETDVTQEEPSDLSTSKANESADGDESSPESQQRKSVFERFEEYTDGAQIQSGDHAVVASREHAQIESADDQEIDEDSPLRERFLAMTRKDGQGSGGQSGAAGATNEVEIAEPVSAEPSDAEPGDAEPFADTAPSTAASENTEDETLDDYEDIEVESPKRQWLVPVLVIVLGLLVGYLAGSWITKNYLSDSEPPQASETTMLL